MTGTCCSPCEAGEVAIHSIVAHPDQFDRQNVMLTGIVTELKETTSHAGNAYTIFKLEDNGGGALTILFGGIRH